MSVCLACLLFLSFLLACLLSFLLAFFFFLAYLLSLPSFLPCLLAFLLSCFLSSLLAFFHLHKGWGTDHRWVLACLCPRGVLDKVSDEF